MSVSSLSAVTSPRLDLAWIRRQFPSLAQTVDGQPAIFFDGPGGTQVAGRVISAISDYLMRSNANLHGSFATSQRTDEVVAEAHRAMADFLHCDSDEIVFGANMTSLTFAMSRALGRELQPGDEIITTVLDHDANVAPWRALEEERGVKVLAVDIHPEDCTLDLADFERKLNRRTKIVAVGLASNAVGTINPLGPMIAMARSNGSLTFVDAVHYAPHRQLDVKMLACDFLVCSTYKFFGPHVGVLYGRREHLARLRPYKVRPASEKLPDRWETGTQNHEGLAGVAACVDYLNELGHHQSPVTLPRPKAISVAFDHIEEYENEIGLRLLNGIGKLQDFTIYGIRLPTATHERTPTVGIRHATLSPAQMAHHLGKKGIFTWHGNFYALNLTERLNLEQSGGMLRIGLAHYNTAEEVDRLLHELETISENQLRS